MKDVPMLRLWPFAFVTFVVFPVADSWAATCTPSANYSVCVITGATTSNPTSSSAVYVTYAWSSSAVVPKSQTIGFLCTSILYNFTVKDEAGTAAKYPITVTPYMTDTIENSTTPFVLNSNFESITFLCDGNHNWLVE
jgi:hypothetical protein